MLKVLAVDFDGVIHDKLHPVAGMRMGEPMPGTKDALKMLKRRYKIIIHTVMARTDQGARVVADWMKYYHLPYDEITAIKPNADIFIDDKAIQHYDWAHTIQAVKERIHA